MLKILATNNIFFVVFVVFNRPADIMRTIFGGVNLCGDSLVDSLSFLTLLDSGSILLCLGVNLRFLDRKRQAGTIFAGELRSIDWASEALGWRLNHLFICLFSDFFLLLIKIWFGNCREILFFLTNGLLLLYGFDPLAGFFLEYLIGSLVKVNACEVCDEGVLEVEGISREDHTLKLVYILFLQLLAQLVGWQFKHLRLFPFRTSLRPFYLLVNCQIELPFQLPFRVKIGGRWMKIEFQLVFDHMWATSKKGNPLGFIKDDLLWARTLCHQPDDPELEGMLVGILVRRGNMLGVVLNDNPVDLEGVEEVLPFGVMHSLVAGLIQIMTISINHVPSFIF